MLAANKGMLWNLENRSLIYSILILFTNSGNWPCPLRPLWKCNEGIEICPLFCLLKCSLLPSCLQVRPVSRTQHKHSMSIVYLLQSSQMSLNRSCSCYICWLPPPRQFIRLIISMTKFCSWSRSTQHLLSAWSRFYPSQATSRWFWRLWLCTLSLPFFAFLCIYVVICCILFFCCFWYSFSFIKLPAFLALG